MKRILLFLSLVLALEVSAQAYIEIQNQKMVLHQNGTTAVLTPNGTDESYFSASVSPDGKYIVYVTAFHGTFVCDVNGNNLHALGRMSDPRWVDNATVAGEQRKYDDNDELVSTRYVSRSILGTNTRVMAKDEFMAIAEPAERTMERKALAAKKFAPKAAGLNGIKIYVNPGHGGYDANDRSCWTIPVPETWTNPDGYWESKSNLTKGLALRDLLESAGATVIMSRTTNKSGIRDLEYYTNASAEIKAELTNGDDRDLGEIAEEANANQVDHFISVHSNALNTMTNYLLMLYHGENGKPTVAQSDLMAESSGNLQIQNQLTVWTSPAPLLRGDITFYGDSPDSPTAGLGVLRPLKVPGFLSEGSFHDYPPESHRLMNADYCKLEALRMYQHFHKWFGRDLPQTATISGWVKSANEKVDVLNQPKFTYVANSDDQWLPLNGAKVELYDATGRLLQTDTTDNWYNGIFAFYDLTPGQYKVVASMPKYETVEMAVTVKAEEIAACKMRLKNVRLDMEDFVETDESKSAMALDKYEMEPVNEPVAAPRMSRLYYRNGYLFALCNGVITKYDLNFENPVNLKMPAGVVVTDFAFTADDYLMACAGENMYTWDALDAEPYVLYKTNKLAGGHFCVSGPRWKAVVTTAADANTYTLYWDEDAQDVVEETSVGNHDTDMPTLMPEGTIFDLTHRVAWYPNATLSPFIYAGNVYVADIRLQDSVCFFALDFMSGQAKAVSDLYPTEGLAYAEGTYVATAAWVEGYEIHVVLAVSGGQAQHFRSLSSPVANVYAGEVSIKDGQISFRLNEDATNVSLSIEKDGEVIDTYSCGAMFKGMQTFEDPFVGKDYDAINITATGRPIAFPVKVSNDDEQFQFYAARGVCVDKTPSSPFFGRIYVAEAVGGQCTEGTATFYRADEMGIYILGSDLTDVTRQGNKAYAGSVEWGENNSGTNYQFALARPAVAPDGDVFVTSTAFASANVYIMNPAAPNDPFVPVFSGKRNKNTGALKTGTKAVTNPPMNCVILGTGKDEVLYTYDRDNSLGTVYGNINQYNIGELEELPWSTVPTRKVFDDMNTGSHMQNASGQIAYDQRGGFFLSQYRYNSSYAIPGLLHVNANGEVDFNIGNDGVDAVQQGGMGISVDGNTIALGTELGTVKVWDVEYDANNAPVLVDKYVINWGNGKGVTMSCDFDAAGNLYIVSNSNERLMVYSLPNANNSYTTRIVTKTTGSAVENVEAEPVCKPGVYTVTGLYLGESAENLPHGMYIINGQKVVK